MFVGGLRSSYDSVVVSVTLWTSSKHIRKLWLRVRNNVLLFFFWVLLGLGCVIVVVWLIRIFAYLRLVIFCEWSCYRVSDAASVSLCLHDFGLLMTSYHKLAL